MRKLSELERPLVLGLLWVKGGKSAAERSFVLQENDPGEVSWESFSVPELKNFLLILVWIFQTQKNIFFQATLCSMHFFGKSFLGWVNHRSLLWKWKSEKVHLYDIGLRRYISLISLKLTLGLFIRIARKLGTRGESMKSTRRYTATWGLSLGRRGRPTTLRAVASFDIKWRITM